VLPVRETFKGPNGVIADGRYTEALLPDRTQMLFQLHELDLAERLPIRGTEEHEHGPFRAHDGFESLVAGTAATALGKALHETIANNFGKKQGTVCDHLLAECIEFFGSALERKLGLILSDDPATINKVERQLQMAEAEMVLDFIETYGCKNEIPGLVGKKRTPPARDRIRFAGLISACFWASSGTLRRSGGGERRGLSYFASITSPRIRNELIK
jgi:hypothetical protein